MISFEKEISLYDKEIYFTKKFSELCDTILFGLSLRIPIILEGEAGQENKLQYIIWQKN